MASFKKSHILGQLAFGTLIIGCLITFFIGLVNGNLFVLSPKVDILFNFIFSISTIVIAFVSIWALLVYYRHKGIPPLIMQSGLFFSAVVVGVTFFSVVSTRLNKQVAKKNDSSKFMKAEEFQKGDPKPELSKVKVATDSLPKQ